TGPRVTNVDANPGARARPPQFNGLSREVDSASDATLEMAARDAPPADKFAIDRWASKHSGPFLIAFASALMVIFSFLMIVWSAVTWWRFASSLQRAPYGGAVRLGPEGGFLGEGEAGRAWMEQSAHALCRARRASKSPRR